MNAVLIEGIPTRTLGVFTVALEIGLERNFIQVVVLARHVVHVETGAANDLVGVVELLGLRQMSDVASMEHEGRFVGEALTLAMASCSVPSAFGLAALSNPTWLSEICRNVNRLEAVVASAGLSRPNDLGTPPATVQRTPVHAQSIHSRACRR